MEPPQFQVLPPEQKPPEKTFLQKVWGWIVGLGLAFAKFKFLMFGALKTFASMFLMIWAYSLFFGWPFAVGIVVMIFIHEMGHVLACLWLGIRVNALMFIPFFGAYTGMQQAPTNAWTEAKISIAGPLAGCIGSWICFYVGQNLQAEWLIAVASVSFIINIINMVPVPPLDGGGICAAISPWFWLIGLVILGGILLLYHSFITSIIIIVVVLFATLPRIQATLFGPPSEEMEAYYAAHLSNRLIMALLYLGLLGVLTVGYQVASGQMSFIWDQPPS